MEFVPLLVLTAIVKKLIDFVRYVRAGEVNAIVVQVCAWAGGVGAVVLASNTAWAGQVDFGGVTLAAMNGASLVLAGIALGSAASLATDVIKAGDNSQSAAVPPLIPPAATRRKRVD